MKESELKRKFRVLYGEGQVRLSSAAGRVNLIGEHVDYCGGTVLPAALDLKCTVAARLRSDGRIRLAATTTDLTAELEIGKLDSYRALKWGNYQAGVAYILQQEGYKICGCDLLYDCTVPFGSGLSSSAAIEVATALTLATFSAENGGKTAKKEELAVMSRRAENEYCGVACGILDQFASAMGKKDHAVLLNCDTLKYEYVPVDLKDCVLVIANSNKPHSLVQSKYNERRAECESAFAVLKKALPEIACLADVTTERFETVKHLLDGKVLDRARHVVEECARVKAAVKAMKAGDIAKLGRLMNESHYSLRDLYEVTGRELDALTDAARSFEGCLGSRMTGGGFGGSAVSLVEKDKTAAFENYVCEKYEAAVGYRPTFYETRISDGIEVR